jgi:hypothetical protein
MVARKWARWALWIGLEDLIDAHAISYFVNRDKQVSACINLDL